SVGLRLLCAANSWSERPLMSSSLRIWLICSGCPIPLQPGHRCLNRLGVQVEWLPHRQSKRFRREVLLPCGSLLVADDISQLLNRLLLAAAQELLPMV